MWKSVVLVSFASVALLVEARAQGGAESLPFHGYIPADNVRARSPEGDGQPNDIYIQFERPPVLASDEIVFYPRNLVGFGIEYGQDPEESVYQIHNAEEVAKLARKKHDKHGKHEQDHQHHHSKGSSKDSTKGKTLNKAPAAATPPPRRPSRPQPQPNYPPPSAPHYSYNSPPQGSFPVRPSPGSYSRPPPPPPQGPYPYRPQTASFPPRLPHQF